MVENYWPNSIQPGLCSRRGFLPCNQPSNRNTVQIRSAGTGWCFWWSNSPRWRTLKLLILRLTPRGLKRPRLLTLRPAAISSSIAANHCGNRSGGNGRSLRHLSPDYTQCVDEAQSVWIELLRPGRLFHELAHREVRQQQAP